MEPDTTKSTSLGLDFFLHLFFVFNRIFAFKSAHGRLVELVNLLFNTGRAQVRDTYSEGFTSAIFGSSSSLELDTHCLFNFWRAFEMVLKAPLSSHDFFLRERRHVVNSRESTNGRFYLQKLVRFWSFSFLSLTFFSDSLAVIFTLSAVFFFGDRSVT